MSPVIKNYLRSNRQTNPKQSVYVITTRRNDTLVVIVNSRRKPALTKSSNVLDVVKQDMMQDCRVKKYSPVGVWHMPHGITLLATPKNGNNYQLLFKQPSIVATFTQHLASHPTSAPLLTTSSPLPSPFAVTSHQDQKGLMPLLALILVSIRDAFLTTYTLLPSHLSEDSHHKDFKLYHTHQIIL